MRLATNVIRVTINDIAIPTADGSVNFNPGGYNRETLNADGKSNFYNQTAVNSTLTGNAIHYSDTDLALLNSANAVIKLETDSDIIWVMEGAISTAPATVSGGVAAFSFEAGPASQQ